MVGVGVVVSVGAVVGVEVFVGNFVGYGVEVAPELGTQEAVRAININNRKNLFISSPIAR